MTLRFIEGFETYGGSGSVPSAMSRKWGSISTAQSNLPNATGRAFGYALKMGTSLTYTGDTMTTQTFTGATTVVVGCGIKLVVSTYTPRFLTIKQGSTARCSFRISGTTVIMLSDGGSTLYTWTGLTNDTNWHHYEIKVVCTSSTSTTATLYYDGVSKGSSGTQSTPAMPLTDINCVTFDCTPASANSTNGAYGGDVLYLDDIFILDSTGSVNNDVIGNHYVEGISPSGAGNSTAWTPSTGSNYAAVDEKPANDDTDYVSSSTAAQRDSYAFSNLSYINGSIKGVCIQANAKNGSGSGSPTFALSNYLSSTYTDGSTQTVSSGSYAHFQEIQEYSSGTTAWTASDVNSAEFGIKLVSG